MNDRKYSYILYFIIIVIVATIALQAYWNYKNYEVNKRQLITDVQTSLDKAVDDYYASIAQESTLSLSFDGESKKDALKDGGILEKISKSIDRNNSSFLGLDSLKLDSIKGLKIVRGFTDSLSVDNDHQKFPLLKKDTLNREKRLKLRQSDSSIKKQFEFFASKIFISINTDSLDLKKVDSLLANNLNDKQIDIDYSLKFTKKDKNDLLPIKSKKSIDSLSHNQNESSKYLSVNSKSTFLPKNSNLKLVFDNANWVAFKRGFSAILISILLVLAVIACLFFLLKVIKDQKQLAEVKNDLISNITHEFKTPIATISAALEGIKSFNIIDDKTKTKEYVDMSSIQLDKLNLMVEKLLETATLDSESLNFNKEPLDIVELMSSIKDRHAGQYNNKFFKMDIIDNPVIINADPFHLENAINNILDNAIKYGGNIITIELKQLGEKVEIQISDNGNTLNKSHKQRIFEKFYRVPKGNTHDIKGHGIGLYYTKTIIEKHQGTIKLELEKKQTTFKITLPFE